MQEIVLPSGVKAELDSLSSEIKITGKLGSTKKKYNQRFSSVKIETGKIIIEENKNKKLASQSALLCKVLANEINGAIKGVTNGMERHMKVVFAHFPVAIEVKPGVVLVKNIFGEKYSREAKIIGDTKVEVKGQDIFVKGVDVYDVGQTVANLNKVSFERNKDSRVFQDGIYLVSEE